MTSVISNTGPLIALSKINQLDLLYKIFGTIVVPPIVKSEVFSKVEYAFSKFIQVTEKPEILSKVEIVTRTVDAGEKQAIALAYNTKGFLIIDDNQARKAASKLDIQYTGSIGVLLLAKQRHIIDSIKEPLQKIRENGYYYSDELIEKTLHLAGEF